MKKLFIIGTGRNGSKLTAKVFSTSVNSKHIHGEIHHGLDPIFFKKAYLGQTSKDKIINEFRQSRNKAIKAGNRIYIEKNHLIVPILNQVLEAYPDALFLYVSRNPKDIIRSLNARAVYQNGTTKYDLGRLSPAKNDKYYGVWSTFTKFEKVCWYVSTMMNMCERFIHYLPTYQYRIIAYENFVKNPSVFKEIFEWLELEFNFEKIKGILGTQIGSSARSQKEVSYKIINKGKFKNTQHWKDWSDERKEIYRRFFGKW